MLKCTNIIAFEILSETLKLVFPIMFVTIFYSTIYYVQIPFTCKIIIWYGCIS